MDFLVKIPSMQKRGIIKAFFQILEEGFYRLESFTKTIFLASVERYALTHVPANYVLLGY